MLDYGFQTISNHSLHSYSSCCIILKHSILYYLFIYINLEVFWLLSSIHSYIFPSISFSIIHIFINILKCSILYYPINLKAFHSPSSIHLDKSWSILSLIIYLHAWILKYFILHNLFICIDLKAFHPLSSIYLHIS